MNPDCLDCAICQGDTSPRDHLRHDHAGGLLCGRCAHLLNITRKHARSAAGNRLRVAGAVRAARWRRWLLDYEPAIRRHLEVRV